MKYIAQVWENQKFVISRVFDTRSKAINFLTQSSICDIVEEIKDNRRLGVIVEGLNKPQLEVSQTEALKINKLRAKLIDRKIDSNRMRSFTEEEIAEISCQLSKLETQYTPELTDDEQWAWVMNKGLKKMWDRGLLAFHEVANSLRFFNKE